MTPRRRKGALWSFSAGGRGYTVTVCERTPGGVLYAKVWDAEAKHQVYVSVGHRDHERAKQYAREESEKLRAGRSSVLTGVVTLGELLDAYLRHRSPEKRSSNSQGQDRRYVELFKRVFGAETPAHDLTLAEWKAYTAKRLAGAIDARGRRVAAKDRADHACGAGGVAADGRFLRSVYYWGMSWRVKGGGTLVSFNPFGAPAKGVKSAFHLPKGDTPPRPLASDERYERLRMVAGRVLMAARSHDSPTAVQVEVKARPFGRYGKMVVPKRWMERSYLYEMLTLAWETGRRRGAWLTLRASDLQWGSVVDYIGATPRRGITAIRWRPTKHAEKDQVVVITRELRRVLEAFLVAHPRIGDVPLFPSHKKPAQAVDPSEVDEWLVAAEKLAELDHMAGGVWHPFRRAWATKRKHHADADVMAGGGWKSAKVLKTIYQLTDDVSLSEMLENPKRLEERGQTPIAAEQR